MTRHRTYVIANGTMSCHFVWTQAIGEAHRSWTGQSLYVSFKVFL